MIGSFGVPVYFKTHVYLADYTNILRRKLSTTCIQKVRSPA